MKKMLPFLLFMTALSLSFANDDKQKERLKMRKEKILKSIDERISKMKDHRDCIDDADKNDDLKNCLHKMKEVRKEFREKMRERKMNRQKNNQE